MRRNDFPPPYLLALDRSDAPAARVHRMCSALRWHDQGLTGRLRNLLLVLAWPIVALRRAAVLVRTKGDAVRAAYGKGLLRQLGEMVWLAIRFAIPPTCYYRFELYDPDRRSLARHYLTRCEMSYVAYRSLLPAKHATTRSLKNKMKFATACEEAGIPHPEIVMAFGRGLRLKTRRRIGDLPACDLFVKRATGKGGDGAELWRFVAPDSFISAEGRTLAREQLAKHLATSSRLRRGALLVQPALKNTAALRDLSGGALCTARLVSIRNESGGHEVTNASFRMAVESGASVDNFHAGGIAAPIDLATGRLGKACDIGRSNDLPAWHSSHPLTGGQIEGRVLPMWPECVALALTAHAVFRDWVVIGWDIAILESGVCLIEGNQGPDVDLIQRPLRQPIGNARFGQLMAMNLEQAWASAKGAEPGPWPRRTVVDTPNP